MRLVELFAALEYGKKELEKSNSLLQEFFNPQKWQEIREADDYQDIRREIYQAGEYYSKKPLTELRYSVFKLYAKTGSRKKYEKVYFDRRGRLNTFAILTLLEPENSNYVNELEDILWAICNEYTWALPAHLDEGGMNVSSNKNPLANNGKIQSFPRCHSYNIDLFAAETAFALSEITFLLENKLSTQVTFRVREEIYKRVLRPYTELNSIFHWELLSMNWAAVCAGSIGAAAIYLIEEDKVLARIIKRVLDTMEVFISGFTDDGVCQEGLEYWNYGFGFFTYFAELLKKRTAGKVDLMDNEKVKEIALFQQRAYISGCKVVSFSDTPREVRFHAGLSSRLNELYSEFELPDLKYKAGFHDDHCYRWPHIIRDLVWFTPQAFKKGQVKKERTIHFLKDTQWLIYKENVNDKSIVFATKGGINNEPHNHNDLGSFIYHLGKTTFLTDLGSGEYTKDYFGPKRYQILCNGSQGHSLPIIEGCFQQEGENSRANIVDYNETGDEIRFSLEIGSAYDNQNLESLIRNFLLNKRDKSLIIKDEFRFKEKSSSVVERFVSQVRPKVLQRGKLQLTGKDSSLLIIFDAKQLEYSFTMEEHINHDGIKEPVYLLDFEADNLIDDSIEIKFKPLLENLS